MKPNRNEPTERRRQGVVTTLASGFLLLALVFSISLASTRHETSGQPRPAVARARVGTAAETRIQPIASAPLNPKLIWTGKSADDITQRRLPGHSECDLQLD